MEGRTMTLTASYGSVELKINDYIEQLSVSRIYPRKLYVILSFFF